MVILMKNDKSLVISRNSRIYQKENIVDSLIFYVPSDYEGYSLAEFTAAMYYTTSTNNAYTELLQLQEESDKEDYLMYKLPVDTKFTASAGKVTLELSFVKNDEETDTRHVLHTSELDVEIMTWADYYKFVPNDSLSSIDDRIAQLDIEADKLKSSVERVESETPNDLTLTEDILQLSRKDEMTGEITLFGEGVEIMIPGDEDDEDESHDGVIDLDSLPDNASLNGSNGLNFVEL